MNKYMGFYELKSASIPSVNWKRFTADTGLEGSLLWTVRVAMEEGDDLNLPRAVGVTADEAVRKGREYLDTFSDKGLVIYYPYFIADKSGVLDLNSSRTVIEAVDKDLWNLVTYGRRNVTVLMPGDRSLEAKYVGDRDFLGPEELDELMRYAAVIRGRYRDEMSEGRSVLAEWSFAYDAGPGVVPKGPRYLVFYELRCV